jgi:hypothetical protein
MQRLKKQSDARQTNQSEGEMCALLSLASFLIKLVKVFANRAIVAKLLETVYRKVIMVCK